MGAWGLGLFDSDHDLDLIGDIGDDAELKLLEPKIRERLETTHSAHVESHQAAGKEDGPLKCHCVEQMEFIYPSLRPYENKDLVRQHLEGPGSADGSKSRATSLVEKYRSELKSGNDIRVAWGPGYKLILLGVCYMQLGMVLPAGLRDTMRRIYRVVGLMRDALKQVEHAVRDYVDGEEYRLEQYETTEADKMYPGSIMMNVPSAGGLFGPDAFKPRTKEGDARKKRELQQLDIPDEDKVCEACGAEKREDGATLLACGRCKQVKYCGKVCQKARFKAHKVVCGK
ncbi:unnamed protein product [Zymoseptoria tritici ST99CH_1A5]|uniref:MYND-type domain-containing protein n=2 Tax=Zymoseptoria tritici TaxID=1047171 RepID=A0A2H1G3R2_ZYMTR|nr:unnamed protein product [Zymoseptoria tritici ST99CH_1E4]SMY22252.1 unnamed protein product [Zymoseptoria tritici ST99CH_1A5]